MSMAIQTNRGENCSICLGDFVPGEQKFTHVGGENHDGFHKPCLAKWLDERSYCPLDRTAIDPSSLISRTERIIARLRPALVSAAHAGIAAGITTGLVTVVRAAGATTVAGVGLGVLTAAGKAARDGAVSAIVLWWAAGATTGCIVAAGATTGLVEGIGIATGASLVGVLVGEKIHQICNRRAVNEVARENIVIGVAQGAIGGIFASTLLQPITAIPAIALIGGCTTGVLSLITRR